MYIMFRQSIDPKGGFPPRSGKKPTKQKSKKGKPIKRRKKTKDPFARERQQERAFRFGERRSGLSGRSVYDPNQFIRFHQSAMFNQARDEAERTRRGGTFTGTSIGEERRVKEQQEVDRLFRKRELENKERFAGALERFVENVKPQQPPPERKSKGDIDAILLPDKEPTTTPIEDKPKSKPPPIPTGQIGGKVVREPQPEPEPQIEDPIAEGFTELADVGTQTKVKTKEVGSQYRRPPEDDLNVKGSTLRRQRSAGSLIEATTITPRDRPSIANPSTTTTIPTQATIEQSSFLANLQKQSQPPQPELTEEEQREIRYKIYDGLVGRKDPVKQPVPELELDLPDLEPDILAIEDVGAQSPEVELARTESQKARAKAFAEFGEGAEEEEGIVFTDSPQPELTPQEIVAQAQQLREEAEAELDVIEQEERPTTPQVKPEFQQPEPEPDPASLRPAQEQKIDARTQYYEQMLNIAKGNRKKTFRGQNQDIPALEILEELPNNWTGRKSRNIPTGVGVYPAKALGSRDGTGNTRKFNFFKEDGITDEEFQLDLHSNPQLFQELINQGKIRFKDFDRE